MIEKKDGFKLKFNSFKDNTLKHGSVWLYLNKSYSKDIGVEWSFRPFDIFNFWIELNGGEGDYTFCFWFIFVFYIKFSNIFNYYPKEWNSLTNDGKGGFLNSASRKIGISMYYPSLNFYIWHDGDNSWYKKRGQKDWQNKKEFKIYHKYIFLDSLIFGEHTYDTIKNENLKLKLKLPENILISK